MSSEVVKHEQVPENPQDGTVFTCSCCGISFTYVTLDDGYSEWVSS